MLSLSKYEADNRDRATSTPSLAVGQPAAFDPRLAKPGHGGLMCADASAPMGGGMSDNIYALFESRFPADRSRDFIEVSGGPRYSYADLEATSARYARLLARLGVVEGDRVAAQVEKSPEALFLYLACMRARAIYLPLNTAYRSAELDYFLRDAEPAVVVCAPEAGVAALARAAGVGHVLTLDAAGGGSLADRSAGLDPAFATVPAEADDIAAILYTSGTTGRSKGAMLSHANLSSNALTLHQSWGFAPDDVLLHALPVYHTHGLFVATNCVLLNGTGMLFLPRFDAAAVMGLLPRATVFMGVPTYYTRLLAEPGFDAEAWPRHAALRRRLRPPPGGDVHRLRGPHGPHGAGALRHDRGRDDRLEPASRRSASPARSARPSPASRPGWPTRTGASWRRTRSASWRSAAPTSSRAIGACPGRRPRNSAPTASSSPATWPPSTSAAMSPSSAAPRTSLSRAASTSILGKSSFASIASRASPNRPSSACPIPDFGEAVTAVVKADDGAASEATIIATLKGELAGFKVPKRVFFVDELPRNPMGKVQKAVLRERYGNTFAAGG